MARWSILVAGTIGMLGGCSSQAHPIQEGPALCIAAYLHTASLLKGTSLEADPQAAELQVRIFYETARAEKTDPLAVVQENVRTIAGQISPDEASNAAKRCLAEEEMSNDYRTLRPAILAAMKKAGKRLATLVD